MAQSRLDRLPSGVRGLDQILCGGLLHPSSYLLAGGPGTGKTVLSSQLAFSLGRQGVNSVFMSVLTEPYSHLIRNLSNFSFFDDAAINREITFVSAFSILEAQGLAGFEEMLRLTLPNSSAKLLVLDNIGLLSGYAASLLDYRAFLQKIISLATMAGVTVLASTDRPYSPSATEYGSFDWIIELRKRHHGTRSTRTLEVQKSRGSFALEGEHTIEIGDGGLSVYPRLESGWLGPPSDRVWQEQLPWGVEGLEERAGGGVRRGTVTGVVGPTGAGKTSMCIAFAAGGIQAGERVIYLSHQENSAQILAAARDLGIDLDADLRSGRLDFYWMPPQEMVFERNAVGFFGAIATDRPIRLIIDGMDAVRRDSVYPERFSLLWTVITNHLRGHGITTFFTTEETPLPGPHGGQDIPWLSVENILVLKYEASRERRRKFLRIMKTRGRRHDPLPAILDLSKRGVQLVALPPRRYG